MRTRLQEAEEALDRMFEEQSEYKYLSGRQVQKRADVFAEYVLAIRCKEGIDLPIVEGQDAEIQKETGGG